MAIKTRDAITIAEENLTLFVILEFRNGQFDSVIGQNKRSRLCVICEIQSLCLCMGNMSFLRLTTSFQNVSEIKVYRVFLLTCKDYKSGWQS